jgi:sporulation protein YlmC with PRC-barrel domain
MKAILTTTCIAGFACLVSAQEATKPRHDTPARADTSIGTSAEKSVRLHKSKDVIGADIYRGTAGIATTGDDKDKIGEVKNLLVSPDGHIAYTVVSMDEGLDTGDKLFAMPWGVLQPAMDRDEDKDECEFVVSLDDARLRTAPSFDEDSWPNLVAVDSLRSVDEFYRDVARGTVREGGFQGDTTGTQPASAARPMLLRLSEVRGCEVDTTTGKDAGEIEEIALDGKNGRVAFAILSTGGFLGLGEDRHAVPWQAFNFSQPTDGDGDRKLTCRLNISESKLENAPKYDKSDWKKVADPLYVERVYSHYGYPAYWTSSDAGVDRMPVDRDDTDLRDDNDMNPDGKRSDG